MLLSEYEGNEKVGQFSSQRFSYDFCEALPELYGEYASDTLTLGHHEIETSCDHFGHDFTIYGNGNGTPNDPENHGLAAYDWFVEIVDNQWISEHVNDYDSSDLRRFIMPY